MPNRTGFPMNPFKTRYSSTQSIPTRMLAAVAALAVACILLAAGTASAAVAPASIPDDPPRQASDTAPTPPALTAQAGENAIELRWDPVPGAVRYQLRVWWDPLPTWQPLAELDSPAVAYTHTGVTPGREYHYTIRVVNDAGQTGAWQQDLPSATVASLSPTAPPTLTPSYTPAPVASPTPTSTPTPTPATVQIVSRLTAPALTAEAVADAIQLRWQAEPGAVRYQLRVWWDTLPAWQPLAQVDAPAVSYTHTGVTPGRKYHYTIRAVNADGQTSDWQQDFPDVTVPAGSDTSTPTSTPTPTPVPSTPPAATATPTPTPVALTPPAATATPTPTATPVTSSPPAPDQSPTPTPTSTLVASPLTPPALTAAAAGGAIQLRWHAVPGAVRYQLRVWWDTLPTWQPLAEVDSPAVSFTHTGVTPGRKYFYTIRVVNADGQTSDWQQDFPDATVPAPAGAASPTPTPTASPTPFASPPALTAQLAYGAIELRWNPVPGAVSYQLKVWWDPLSDWRPLVQDGLAATTYTHTGVTPGREYFYTIRALNAAGNKTGWQLDFATATLPVARQRVAHPPAHLGLDPYYRKYLDAAGIPVVASADVDDAELYHAHDIILAMLSNRPDLLAAMSANRYRVIIYEHDGCRGPYQVPELRDDLPPGSCTRTTGIASLTGRANRFTGEFVLVIESIGVAPATLPYCNFIFVHEFAHLIDYTLSFRLPGPNVFDPLFEPRVRNAYNAALAAGLYQDAYAATDWREYWAEAVTFWFLPDMLTGQVRTPAHVSKLADYDPAIATLVGEVFGNADLPDCNPVHFRVLGTVTGPQGDPLAGVTVVANVRVVPRISPYFWHFTKETLPTRADGAYALAVSKPRLARVRRLVLRETGESDLNTHFILGVAAGPNGACPAGYLNSAGGKVENIPARSAARFAIPDGDLSGIALTLAPNFEWTQQICLPSNAPLPKDRN